MISIDNAQNEIGLPGHIDDGREWTEWLLKKADESGVSNKNEITMGIDELLENEKALHIVAKSLGYSKKQFIEELCRAQSEGLQYIKFEYDEVSNDQ
ncbi:hypothetical protein [Xenorhabdus budapestensis]|uniref:Uncharacterized protein n=1 Tax=Xenorhabdus budapestensis TaxID=290110 RepID=A0A2D0J3V2_XENBU|nr:hypothetical protein [Xenorhabdus budapestensis]PHM29110.1 hypothetical protein Xbud_00551 [Xenorhabdus budapestensis]QTL38744.1 hypothetical protein HGO23_12730 [Xenorhabdus budapestensis]